MDGTQVQAVPEPAGLALTGFGLAALGFLRRKAKPAESLFRKSPAMEMTGIGEPIPAERAYSLGLVTRLVEPGKAVDEAVALAQKICENAPLAVWASRKVVLAAAWADDETLKRMTSEEFATVLSSEDTKEGLTAFIEKRVPNWKGA